MEVTLIRRFRTSLSGRTVAGGPGVGRQWEQLHSV